MKYILLADIVTAAYIPTGKGKKNLILNGYSFTETTKNAWSCSKRKKGCPASARTNNKGEVISYKHGHNHEKPSFYQKTTQKIIQL